MKSNPKISFNDSISLLDLSHNIEFMNNYKKSILLSLLNRKLINKFQYEKCIELLSIRS